MLDVHLPEDDRGIKEMSILIKDITKEERERIVDESIGNVNGSCDGCMSGLADDISAFL